MIHSLKRNTLALTLIQNAQSQLVVALMASASLVGCGTGFTTDQQASSSVAAADSGAQVDQSSEEVNKALSDLEAALRKGMAQDANKAQKVSAKSLGLNEAQISSILSAATQALSMGGLTQSNDLSAILPTLIQGAAIGTGGLKLDNETISGVLSLIGGGALTTVLPTVGTDSTDDLVKLATSSLFSSFNLAGVRDPSVPAVSGSVIQSLLGQLNGGSMSTTEDLLPMLVNSLGSGSVSGLGNLGLPTNLLNSSLGSLGSGSGSGLMNIALNVGLASTGAGAAAPFITSLLNSFMSGSGGALGGINIPGVGTGGSSGANSIKALLASLFAGVKGSPISSIVSGIGNESGGAPSTEKAPVANEPTQPNTTQPNNGQNSFDFGSLFSSLLGILMKFI